ncbi:MAG TPA: hypothetical protein VGR27_13850 [Longimicrobiaceae bacterium]|nr:hypothetical protein [Longimicrobiaceae bacterium]
MRQPRRKRSCKGRLRTSLPLLLATLATSTQEAQAQAHRVGTGGSTYINEVRDQLNYFARQSGYPRTHELFFDRLNHRRYQSVTVDLVEGVNYLIVGACDNDCSDLDFELYDENDNYIDGDTASDDIPMVELEGDRLLRQLPIRDAVRDHLLLPAGATPPLLPQPPC